ncbi:MAG: FAD-dependent oxidoreductase, partial [Paracoccus sp. (in: a-proteobacteria)]
VRHDAGSHDLVVIGAGVAGLNALYAAVRYLPKGARVLLIDQKPVAGGMWTIAYDYVRLHQPHPMFTVGNLAWNWTKPPDYLATRDEVQRHLASALDRIADRVRLETRFGHTVSACDEIETGLGRQARVSFHPNDDPARVTTVTASRAIHAQGVNYRPSTPLALSSRAVIPIIPQDLRTTLAAHPKAPLYVIGGGKSGMDTILAAIEADPSRRVVLVSGPGTSFINRDRNFPIGVKRWVAGLPLSRMGRDLGTRFDGDNEEAVLARFRRHYSSDPEGPDRVFLFGIQSSEERARISAGLSRHHRDYLIDVTDEAQGPVMALRGGAREAVEPGSIFVTCTGSIVRGGAADAWQPCLSPGDAVLRIDARDSYHLLTSVSGFFMVHLLYRGLLRGTGHYTLDHEALFARNRNAWAAATITQLYMHRVLSVQLLPLKLLNRCALDFDRWYPVPRRLLSLVQLKSSAVRDLARCRAALDRVADRFGIPCGPLE